MAATSNIPRVITAEEDETRNVQAGQETENAREKIFKLAFLEIILSVVMLGLGIYGIASADGEDDSPGYVLSRIGLCIVAAFMLLWAGISGICARKYVMRLTQVCSIISSVQAIAWCVIAMGISAAAASLIARGSGYATQIALSVLAGIACIVCLVHSVYSCKGTKFIPTRYLYQLPNGEYILCFPRSQLPINSVIVDSTISVVSSSRYNPHFYRLPNDAFIQCYSKSQLPCNSVVVKPKENADDPFQS